MMKINENLYKKTLNRLIILIFAVSYTLKLYGMQLPTAFSCNQSTSQYLMSRNYQDRYYFGAIYEGNPEGIEYIKEHFDEEFEDAEAKEIQEKILKAHENCFNILNEREEYSADISEIKIKAALIDFKEGILFSPQEGISYDCKEMGSDGFLSVDLERDLYDMIILQDINDEKMSENGPIYYYPQEEAKPKLICLTRSVDLKRFEMIKYCLNKDDCLVLLSSKLLDEIEERTFHELIHTKFHEFSKKNSEFNPILRLQNIAESLTKIEKNPSENPGISMVIQNSPMVIQNRSISSMTTYYKYKILAKIVRLVTNIEKIRKKRSTTLKLAGVLALFFFIYQYYNYSIATR